MTSVVCTGGQRENLQHLSTSTALMVRSVNCICLHYQWNRKRIYTSKEILDSSDEQNSCHCTSIEHTLRSSVLLHNFAASLHDFWVGLGSLLRIGLLIGGSYTSFLDLTEAHLYLRIVSLVPERERETDDFSRRLTS